VWQQIRHWKTLNKPSSTKQPKTLDRARAHLESLNNTREKDRILNKLKIKLLMVIDKGNRAFQNR